MSFTIFRKYSSTIYVFSFWPFLTSPSGIHIVCILVCLMVPHRPLRPYKFSLFYLFLLLITVLINVFLSLLISSVYSNLLLNSSKFFTSVIKCFILGFLFGFIFISSLSIGILYLVRLFPLFFCCCFFFSCFH